MLSYRAVLAAPPFTRSMALAEPAQFGFTIMFRLTRWDRYQSDSSKYGHDK